MKVTFQRLGHSNNSSSSHSLIFTTNDKLADSSNESKEFGWQKFTCSSKEDKSNYLLTCVWDSWTQFHGLGQYFNFPYHDGEYSESCKEFRRQNDFNVQRLFRSFVKDKLGIDANLDEVGNDSCVDHQSCLTMPITRDASSLHYEFIRALYKEFVNNNWYIYGGNNNSPDPRDPPFDDEPHFEDFKSLWRFLRDQPPKSILCVYDGKTGEYVLSRGGGLMKIKFNS